MKAAGRHTRLVLATLATLASLFPAAPALSQDATIGGYQLVSEVRVTRTLFEYTYRATLTNAGPALSSATATASSLSPATTITDGTLTFGPVGSGDSGSSTDTFSFQHDRTVPFSWSNIEWTLSATPANQAPYADAGADVSRFVTETAQLDGSASSDPDGHPLTYRWTFLSRPAGSAATLDNPTAVAPTFLVDRPGSYIVELVVNDGFVDSAPDTVVISTLNSPPVANAGPDQTAFVGNLVGLDASQSSDVDGDLLAFAWSFASLPPGSAAVLSDPAAMQPSFTVDRPGTYVLQLVVNDGSVDSAPDTVVVSTLNSAPVAHAGPDQTVFVDDTVTLDGTGSSDVDGDVLTFAWSFTSVPQGSAATLSDPAAVQPSFTVDRSGSYVLQLVVNDGSVDSPPDTVVISTLNSAPVANAGPDQTAFVGDPVTLDGSQSTDADGDLLTFTWSFASVPQGSAATLSDPTAVQPSFTVDEPGTYVVQLAVNDGTLPSLPDTVVVSTLNSPPLANAGPDQTAFVGDTVTLDGSASSDVDGDVLTFAWSFASLPPGSAALLSDPTAVQPSFAVDEPGTYVLQLVVNDGSVNSPPDTVVISTLNSAPVANAGPDQTAFVGDTVSLDGSPSGDADGDALTFQWALIGKPAGSTAVLSSASAFNPTLLPDLAGDYLIQLTVNDGHVDSAPDTVLIHVLEVPVALSVLPESLAFPGTVIGEQSAAQPVEVTNLGATDITVSDVTLTGAFALQANTCGLLAPASSCTIEIRFAPIAEGPALGTATITSDAPEGPHVVSLSGEGLVLPTVTLAAADAAASEAGGDPGEFTFTRTGSTAAPLLVLFDVGGTALGGSDYAPALSGTVTIPSGQASATVAITPSDDGDFEGEETVDLTLITSVDYTIGAPSTATVTIADDDLPVVTVVATDAAASEVGLDPGTLTVSRTGSTTLPLAVTYAVTGTATAGADYTALPGVVTFGAGQAAAILAIEPSSDPLVEGDETAVVTLTDDAAYDLGAPAVATVTIADQPTPVVTVIAGDAAASEAGLDPGSFTVSRSGDTTFALTVDFTAGGTATAGDDYASLGSSLTIPAGQGSATVTLTPLPDVLIEGAETVELTLSDGAQYDPGPPSAATVTIADDDQPGITLALVGTPVVGVGESATLEIVLGAPAPPGGLTVTVTSDNPGLLTVAAPGTAFVPQGATVGLATLNGVAPGHTVVRATAPGYSEGQLGVMVTQNILALPLTLNVPLGQTTNLPVIITRAPGNDGPIDVTLASGNPAIVAVTTPTVTVPAGQLTVNATVSGQSPGSATVTATAPGFVTDTASVTTTANLDITVGSLTFNSAFGASITIELESPPGSVVAAPAGGLALTLAAADPTCVSVPAAVLIAQGTISVAAPLSYGGGAALPCTTILTASGPAGVVADTVSVTVTPAPGISVPALGSVGGGLQTSTFTATLGADNHGGVIVRVESSDPTRVLVAPDTLSEGAPFIEVPVANLAVAVPFVVQGVDWAEGASAPAAVAVTVTASGFNDGSGTVAYVRPGLQLSGLLTSIAALSGNDPFAVRVGVPSAGTGVNAQVRRIGGPPLVVTITNSNPAVAELDLEGGGTTGAQQQTLALSAGFFETPSGAGSVQLDPLDLGTTTVTASIPGFLVTSSGTVEVTVTGAGITMPNPGSIGGGLQTGSLAGSLGASGHGGVTVRLTSSDPARVLVAPNATTAGSPFIDIPVADGQVAFQFVLQGLDWVPGSSSPAAVTLTASAPGFSGGSSTATYVQPGLQLSGLVTSTTSLSVNDDFAVRVGVPNSGQTAVSAQVRRFGAPPLEVTVTNSEAAVAELDLDGSTTGAQQQTVEIAAQAFETPAGPGGVEFDPLGIGTTSVTASIPGFLVMSTGVATVTVTGPGITVSGLGSVAGGLQTGAFLGTLGASAHGGVTVHVTSSDPTRVLIAPNVTTAGSPFIDVTVPNGQTSFAFVLQGMDWTAGTSSPGTVTVTATAGGFSPGSNTVSYVQPGLQLVGLVPSTTAVSANDPFAVRVGVPNPGSTSVAAQARRIGGGPLVATVTNDTSTVAELDLGGGVGGAQQQTVSIAEGAFDTPSAAAGVELDPLGTGTTVVTASIPGFIVTAAGTFTVTVTGAGITLPAVGTVGGGLQTGVQTGTLGGPDHGGVAVRITSSDPTRVLVAPNATSAGAPFIDVSVADGQTSFQFVVQGADWVVGSSSGATVTVTASAPGFSDGSRPVTYAQPGLQLTGLVTSTTAASVNDDFSVRIGVPNPGSTAVTPQVRRFGNGPLSVTVTNSSAAVAELDQNGGVSGAQQQTVSIVEGSFETPNGAGGVEFDPLSAGTTVVSASIPGFVVTTAGSQTVIVN